MITLIPKDQLCEAYDPIMVFPEKTKHIIDDPMKANTSCIAPAYVYMEGSRGKRFLCDYHYFCEKILTLQRTPELWKDIENYIVDNLEQIKDNFINTKSSIIKDGTLCWCGKQSYVLAEHRKSKDILSFCNFHYRKSYYRYLSNNVDFLEQFDVIDERYKMKESIHQEAENLTVI
jgi:hypothetical protein